MLITTLASANNLRYYNNNGSENLDQKEVSVKSFFSPIRTIIYVLFLSIIIGANFILQNYLGPMAKYKLEDSNGFFKKLNLVHGFFNSNVTPMTKVSFMVLVFLINFILFYLGSSFLTGAFFIFKIPIAILFALGVTAALIPNINIMQMDPATKALMNKKNKAADDLSKYQAEVLKYSSNPWMVAAFIALLFIICITILEFITKIQKIVVYGGLIIILLGLMGYILYSNIKNTKTLKEAFLKTEWSQIGSIALGIILIIILWKFW